MSALRIISLLPAATEIICALDLEAALVGRSHACYYPASVKSLPVCTTARLKAGLGVLEQKLESGDFLSAALSVDAVDMDKIENLNPDVVITETQFANSPATLSAIASSLKALLGKPVQVIFFQPHRLVDFFEQIKQIAHQLQVDSVAEDFLEALQERLDIIRHKLKFVDQKPTLAAITALNPLILAGDLVRDLIEISGGQHIFGPSRRELHVSDWEDVRLANPQVIILMLAGQSIQQTLQQINEVMQWPGFESLTAIKSNHFYIANGNSYFNRRSLRLVDAAEILAEILHPKQFIFGYEGEGWIRFES
ncbi:MAG: ABC transporter substrate-binding protein [Sphingobacteriaceae bacterium]